MKNKLTEWGFELLLFLARVASWALIILYLIWLFFYADGSDGPGIGRFGY